jgi:hypothetical protein
VFDTIQKRVPWVVAAVMVLAVTGQAALAGTDDGISPSAVANVNADQVDGRHAIKYTSNKTARKGRLMAIGATGYLPDNIILKAMDADKIDGIDSTALATIAALKSAAGAINEADNLVHWNQLLGVPASIADGVDEGDGYDSSIAVIMGGNDLAVAQAKWIAFDVPAGVDVETTIIPAATAPASVIETLQFVVTRIDASILRHHYYIQNYVGSPATTFKVRVRVFNQAIAPAALKQVANHIRVITSKKARP